MNTLQRQIAALPVFRSSGGEPEVCIVTSRGSGRWIIPKGNPIPGLSPEEVAAREAFEEAGLLGKIQSGCIGTFEFHRRRRGCHVTCHVDVYVLHVDRQARKWEEMKQRSVFRCGIETAASLVCSASLAELIWHYSVETASGRTSPT